MSSNNIHCFIIGGRLEYWSNFLFVLLVNVQYNQIEFITVDSCSWYICLVSQQLSRFDITKNSKKWGDKKNWSINVVMVALGRILRNLKFSFSETDENIKRMKTTKCYHWWIITVTIMHNLTMVNKVSRERIAGSKPHFRIFAKISEFQGVHVTRRWQKWGGELAIFLRFKANIFVYINNLRKNFTSKLAWSQSFKNNSLKKCWTR